MPSPEQVEYAGVLLRKAEGDLGAVTALLDRSEIADDIVGFHAQQAVEKAAKGVLTLRGIDYRGPTIFVTSPSCSAPPRARSRPRWPMPLG